MAGIFEVDDAKCVSCGVCVRDCAFHALKMEQRFDPRDTSERKMSAARFKRFGNPVRFFWFADSLPSDRLGFDRVTVWVVPGRSKQRHAPEGAVGEIA